LIKDGFLILFDGNACVITDKKSRQTTTNVLVTQTTCFLLIYQMLEVLPQLSNEAYLWCLHYGNLNINGLKRLSQKAEVVGLPKIGQIDLGEGCIYGKQTRRPFPVGKSCRVATSLEVVHADLCGPMKTESLSRSWYFLLFIDDYNLFSWVYFLKFKSKTFDNLKKFKAFVEDESGKKLKALCTDRSGEFLSSEFTAYCDEHGIHRELTAPHTLEQNGVVEWKNKTVVEMARGLLKAKGLSNYFWGEAIATAVYLLNISPTKAVLNKTPFEA